MSEHHQFMLMVPVSVPNTPDCSSQCSGGSKLWSVVPRPHHITTFRNTNICRHDHQDVSPELCQNIWTAVDSLCLCEPTCPTELHVETPLKLKLTFEAVFPLHAALEDACCSFSFVIVSVPLCVLRNLSSPPRSLLLSLWVRSVSTLTTIFR